MCCQLYTYSLRRTEHFQLHPIKMSPLYQLIASIYQQILVDSKGLSLCEMLHKSAEIVITSQHIVKVTNYEQTGYQNTSHPS